MTATPFRILHPTDFSAGGGAAFAHALWIALCMKARLYLLHVETESDDGPGWTSFPHVRDTLARWGVLALGEPPEAMERLGVGVAKVSVASTGLAKGVVELRTSTAAT